MIVYTQAQVSDLKYYKDTKKLVDFNNEEDNVENKNKREGQKEGWRREWRKQREKKKKRKDGDAPK